MAGFAAAFACSQHAQAETETNEQRASVGFSSLVARLDNDEIGLAKAEYRIHILEALRDAGFNAVGAESLVFNRDEGDRADLVLGGTVKELQCQVVDRRTNCRIAIDWEVLDRSRDSVVYRVRSRSREFGISLKESSVAGRRLVLGALHSLMKRERFIRLMNEKHEVPDDDEQDLVAASFRSCSAPDRELPAQFTETSAATALVSGSRGFGSGFVVSPDGLLLTAAHVVDGERNLRVKLGGTDQAVEAKVLRVSHRHDVALVRIAQSEGAPVACLALETTPPVAGDDIYAIGSPASQELAFSLSRGIVSGLRQSEGVSLIQTDASLSPGNSGGPLLDKHAKVVGVVSRKIAGHAVEGLGFGVQVVSALEALALAPGDATSEGLLRSSPVPAPTKARESGAFNDVADPVLSLDPEGDRRRLEETLLLEREEARSNATPWFVKPMRYGGLAMGLAGGLGVIVTGLQGSKDGITYSEYQSYRTLNDLSWAAVVVGGAAFIVSFPLEPPLPDSDEESAFRSVSVSAGPGKVELGLRFQ